MSEDRDALDPQSPGKAGDLFGIVANRLEDGRVHHAATAELDPPGFLAHLTAGAVALPAADVDFGARLGVRKKARADPDARVGREHLTYERVQCALEVGHRDVWSDDERFDLAVGRRV